MKQRYFCFISLVEGKIQGTEKRGRRRKQLCITITKREGTEMREEALIAVGRGLVSEKLWTRRKTRCGMEEWNTLFSQYPDFFLSVLSHP
jgi:hypothetical protein